MENIRNTRLLSQRMTTIGWNEGYKIVMFRKIRTATALGDSDKV